MKRCILVCILLLNIFPLIGRDFVKPITKDDIDNYIINSFRPDIMTKFESEDSIDLKEQQYIKEHKCSRDEAIIQVAKNFLEEYFSDCIFDINNECYVINTDNDKIIYTVETIDYPINNVSELLLGNIDTDFIPFNTGEKNLNDINTEDRLLNQSFIKNGYYLDPIIYLCLVKNCREFITNEGMLNIKGQAPYVYFQYGYFYVKNNILYCLEDTYARNYY